MNKKLFWILLGLILVLSLSIRVIILQGDNLFFTVDQGRDAIYIREILERGQILLKGPETSIRGVFTGPLWYYFSALGYLLTAGHPWGGILMLILLNTATVGYVIWWLAKKTDKFFALLAGLGLSIFWPFFETSLWSFNPFPVAALSILLITLLIDFLEGRKKAYVYALIPILLAFNANVASALALLLFYILVGGWAVRKNLIAPKTYLVTALALPAVGAVVLVKQFITLFINTKVITYTSSGAGVFSGTNFQVTFEFLKMLGATTFPWLYPLGAVLFLAVTYLFFQNKKTPEVSKRFLKLTLVLVFISFVFFASNQGWKSWHTVYISPLLFISLLLMLYSFTKKVRLFLIGGLIALQLVFSTQRYLDYIKPSDNPSILYNQINAVGWIYKNAEDQGFAVFNYTDTFYDHPYQYLFWWYGLAKFNYLPCEYSNFPRSIKSFYVPGYEHYLEPKRECTKSKFLIVQSETNGEKNKDWIHDYRTKLDLVSQIQIGKITVEKYYVKPSQSCIIWNTCQ